MSSKHEETHREAQKPDSKSPETAAEGKGPEGQEMQTGPASAGNGAAPASESAEEHDGKAVARIAELEKELASVREELSSVNDKYLRKLADDVNFRKRMVREKEDAQRFALSGLLGDLIPVLDDFDRAIASAETQRDYGVLHDGISLIRRQLGSVLENKYGLVRFAALGQAFDPNRHEAVAMIQGGPEGGDEAVVAEEFLPGYALHDRIVRTAKVRVLMPGPKTAAEPVEGAQEAAATAGDTTENE